MYTPPANHRYRGPRESKKLVLQTQASIGDLTLLTYTYDSIESNYNSYIPAQFTNLDSAFQSEVQRARVLEAFARRIAC